MILKKMICNLVSLATAVVVINALLTPTILAQETTPGFNNKIPESILTPDEIKTKVGTLKFFDGIPTKETASLLFENLDLNRGVDAFLNGMPAANFEAGRAGHLACSQKRPTRLSSLTV